jgi:hypothetical protein
MAASNTNAHSQKHDRFLDANQEPRKMLQPIEGYQHLPLVSLEEALSFRYVLIFSDEYISPKKTVKSFLLIS